MIEPDEIDWLAAQYTLGVLPPAERRLVQARIGQDHLLAEAIDAWERRLAPLSLGEPGLTPPPRVLEGVLATLAQRRISGQPAQTAEFSARPATQLRPPRAQSRWRMPFVALAAALSAIAIGLGSVLFETARQQQQITGLLAPVDQSTAADEPTRSRGAAFAVSLDAGTQVLTVRSSANDAARTDRTYVLWLTTGKDAEAVMLGRLETDGVTQLRINDIMYRQIRQGRLLVTLEGEASTLRPRGPTVATGMLAQ